VTGGRQDEGGGIRVEAGASRRRGGGRGGLEAAGGGAAGGGRGGEWERLWESSMSLPVSLFKTMIYLRIHLTY
jgi:hypothetical protein